MTPRSPDGDSTSSRERTRISARSAGDRVPPEVVLFDLGGVLMDFGGLRRLADLTGRPDGPALRSRWADDPWVRAFERGACTTGAFARAVVEDWDLDLTPGEFVDDFRTWSDGPFPGALDLLRSLHGSIQLGCLSNTNAVHWQQHLDRWNVVEHFDWTFTSHQIGLAKPDPKVFHHVIDTIDVAPGRLLFLDDSLDNVRAARRAGMRAEHTRGLQEVRDALARHLPADSDAGRRLRA